MRIHALLSSNLVVTDVDVIRVRLCGRSPNFGPLFLDISSNEFPTYRHNTTFSIRLPPSWETKCIRFVLFV